jgi:hypothetical protein
MIVIFDLRVRQPELSLRRGTSAGAANVSPAIADN